MTVTTQVMLKSRLGAGFGGFKNASIMVFKYAKSFTLFWVG